METASANLDYILEKNKFSVSQTLEQGSEKPWDLHPWRDSDSTAQGPEQRDLTFKLDLTLKLSLL